MHDERRTTDDDGPQPKAIGHLSDSGDLTRYKSEQMTYNPLRLLQSPLLRAGARAWVLTCWTETYVKSVVQDASDREHSLWTGPMRQ